MRIETHKHGAVSVVKPGGSIAGDDAGKLREHLLAARTESLGRVLLDLASVPLLDSRTLEVMLEIAELQADGGRTLKVCGLREVVREVLELTGVLGSVEVFDEPGSAVRSFR